MTSDVAKLILTTVTALEKEGYGEVKIVIHDYRVKEVDATKKIRFETAK